MKIDWSNYLFRLIGVNKLVLVLIFLISLNANSFEYPYFFLYLPFIVLLLVYSIRDAKYYIYQADWGDGVVAIGFSEYFKRQEVIVPLAALSVECVRNQWKFYDRYLLIVSSDTKKIVQFEILGWNKCRMIAFKAESDIEKDKNLN